MKKLISSLYIRIIISLIIGGFLAFGFTKTFQPCTTTQHGENISQCAELTKVASQPSLLKSDSKVRDEFLKNFATVSIVSFGLISVVYYYKKNKNSLD